MNELARENGRAMPCVEANATSADQVTTPALVSPDLADQSDAQRVPEPSPDPTLDGSSGPTLLSLARAAQRTARIRALNDQLRQSGRGGAFCVTRGVALLEWTRLVRVMDAVVEFDAFGPDNDPHGEHDCAVIAAAGVSVIWKIDYYDQTMTGLSPDPADPSVTRRVLTIMLASEY